MRPLLVAALLVFGCAPVNAVGRARTLPVGKTQIVAAPHVGLVAGGSFAAPSLVPELSARYGFTDSIEAGGRVWAVPLRGFSVLGAAGDLKLQLKRSDRPDSGVDVAFAPSLGYHQLVIGGTPTARVVFVSAPVLVGFNLSERVQLVLGPMLADQIWTSPTAGTVNAFLYGSSAALAIRIADKVTVMPQAALLFTPLTVGRPDAPEPYRATRMLQLSLGFLFEPQGAGP